MSESKFGIDWEKVDKVNLGLGVFVAFVSFVVYLMTVQRTLSFWDCGEFVSCAYILGIPHPFGSPLFILIGRIFSLLPLAADVGFRINLIATISEAIAAGIGYFVIVKLVREWFGNELDQVRRIGMYVGGLIGAFLMAFAYSNWNSAIEAEVYGIAMLLMNVIIWLTLTWSEKRHEAGSNKWLVLIVFLAVLSMAEHMTTYMIMPFIFLMLMLISEKLRSDWRIWVTGFVLMSVIVSIPMFMILVCVWLVICGFTFIASRSAVWALPFFLIAATFVGYSIQLTTLVRAGEKPAINENAPSNWKSFMDYLQRKQYGQISMAERMFTRRGTWANQFGTHERMGFWGFFNKQYGLVGKYFAIPFLLGMLGLLELALRRWRKGVPFLLMAFAATAGMVIYMNFADGTMGGKFANDEAYLEVRDRDYFWQPGFILFALSIGIGFVALWDMIYTQLRGRKLPIRLTYALLVFLLMPIVALKANWFQNDRSRNFIAYDYAYNLLMSCDSNAVVFTNGDNDTFPVWCLQEAYGIRKDVRIANLSLINTDWYIKQLKNEMGVPISFTDSQIDNLRHTRMADGRTQRIQDLMIDNIIETANWKTPVHFAVTVSDDNRLYKGKPIDDHLEMNGMMYRVKRETGKDMIDIDGTVRLYRDVFKYRGVGDSTVYKDENAARLTNNYAAGFLYAAEALRKQGRISEAMEMSKQSIQTVPSQWQSYAYLMQMFADLDSLQRVEEIVANAPPSVDIKPMLLTLANDYWSKKKNTSRAYEILNRVLERDPSYKAAYSQLLSYYYQDKQYDSLENVLTRWAAVHPTDAEAQDALAEVRRLKATDTSRTGVKVRQVELPGDSQ